MRMILMAALVAAVLGGATPARAQLKAKAAREVAEFLFERFGAKVGKGVPELTTRIEGMTARYGEETLLAVRKGGPAALGLVEAAGPDGAKAVRVLAVHGEQGATRVLSRPTAMRQFLQHGEGAAEALCRHPGVAEPLIERGGEAAVKALTKVEAQSGRRLAMLLEKEIADVSRHPQVFGVVEKYGEKAVDFMWKHKEVLAGAAALTAFLANPEPYLNGVKSLTEAVGNGVVKPVADGMTTVLTWAVGLAGVIAAGIVFVLRKTGLPSAEAVLSVLKVFKR